MQNYRKKCRRKNKQLDLSKVSKLLTTPSLSFLMFRSIKSQSLSPKEKFIRMMDGILSLMKPEYLYVQLRLKTMEKRYLFFNEYAKFKESNKETITTEQWAYGPKNTHEIKLENISEIGYTTKKTTHEHWIYVEFT